VKQIDLDRAFPPTPDCIHSAIELGFRKGQKHMKTRNRIIAMSSIAAVLAIMLAAAALTMGIDRSPRPDVLAQPPVTDVPKVKEEPMVWYTEKGNDYHFDEHCSGMEGAKHRPLSEAQEMGKNACPVCGPSEYNGQTGRETIEYIYYSEEGQYFHKSQTCAGETYPLKTEALNSFFAVADASVNKAPCPVCLPYGITMIGNGAYVNLHKAPGETNPAPEADSELLSGDSMVYAATSGKYYHIDQHCSGMEDALYLPMTEALEQGKGACPVCIPETSPLRDFSRNPLFVGEPESNAEDTLFWCTEKGNYYHTDQHCCGMEGAICATLSYALALDKTPCPVCITGSEDAPARNAENTSVYATYGKPLYYHKAAICNGQQNKRALTIADAEKEQLRPCPDCYAVNIAAENTETAEPVFYCTPNGKYYHYEPDCSGMAGAKAHTAEQAIINSGKNACPVCFNTEERKALYMLPAPRHDTDEVYCSAENSYYHIDPNCFSVTNVSIMDLLSARDSAKTACPVCLKEQADISALETCWSTKHGRYFHSDEHCSGMQNAVSGLVEEARSAGKMRCPVCMKTTPENYDLFTAAFGQEIENFYSGYIYDHSIETGSFLSEWYISNGKETIKLCEIRPEGSAFFGEELPGLPELCLTGLAADPKQAHEFMKAAPTSIGSMYAAASAELEKQTTAAGGSVTAEEVQQLQEVVVYFDANRRVRACEMQFGFYDHVKLAWKVNADGRIELTESDFVRPGSDWNHLSGETMEEAADEVIVTATPSPVEFKTLSSPMLPDTLYQAAFGNLEKALDLGYGFFSKDSSHLDFSFVPKEENRYTLFGGGQIVLTLNWQENANASPLKYTMNVRLDGTREGSKRFMESVSAQPMASLYPQAVQLAREYLASIHQKEAENFDPYADLLMMGFDEAKMLYALQIDFRNDEESFGIEFIPANDSRSAWKTRIIS